MCEKGVAQVGCLSRWGVVQNTSKNTPSTQSRQERKLRIFTDLQSTDPSCPAFENCTKSGRNSLQVLPRNYLALSQRSGCGAFLSHGGFP